MHSLKCALHVHSGSDPIDPISYTEEELFAHAQKVGLDAIALTCHEKVIHTKNLEVLAAKYNLLLIPGIEAKIEGKEVIILGATPEVDHIKSFRALKLWKDQNPNSFIFAPHPFFPNSYSLNKKFADALPCLDGLEHSFFYTKLINYNKKAKHAWKSHKLTLVSTPDTHFLEHLDINYCIIETPEKTVPAVLKALKEEKLQNHTYPLPFLKFLKICVKMLMLNFKEHRNGNKKEN